ncbi:MAG: flagellar basal body P-ring formation protein FlgA [Candidatus Krumholzibacteriota bacterium]|nr:flagellar basal body P-ring formation protein FlgA [Candidatus Krumholzibacteriota bacterium]
MKRKNGALIIVAVMLSTCSALASAEVYTLREIVVTEMTLLKLSDLVVEPLKGSDDPVIAESPPWGSQKSLSRNFIADRVRSLGIELTGNTRVQVKRLMFEKCDELLDLLKKDMASALKESKWSEGAERIEMEIVNFPSSIMTPPGQLALEIDFPKNIHGYQVVSFTLTGKDGFKRRYSTGCRFHLVDRCAVAARDIKRGEVVETGDIEWVEADLAVCGELPVTDPADIRGMRIDRYIRSGDMIPLKAIERIPVVMKGQTVKVEISRGLMVVSANGVSLEDGWIGDMVLVRNLASGKIDKYQVVDKAKVSPPGSEAGR